MENKASINNFKVFVPNKELSISLRFYQAMGFKCQWQTEGLAAIELANQCLYLQEFYVKEWAENFMIYIDVNDAQAWFNRVNEMANSGQHPGIRVAAPKLESHGAWVTYVWDPAGVLLHLAEASN